jgi:hypothetical protein
MPLAPMLFPQMSSSYKPDHPRETASITAWNTPAEYDGAEIDTRLFHVINSVPSKLSVCAQERCHLRIGPEVKLFSVRM